MSQNYKNHTRLVPVHHYVSGTLILVLTVASVVELAHNISEEQDISLPLFKLGLMVLITLVWLYARAFALKAQDRVILLEEKLRHQQLTGKPLNSQLRLSQIIALRFASDDEFPALADKAAAENLSSKTIKQSIRNWKADHHRV